MLGFSGARRSRKKRVHFPASHSEENGYLLRLRDVVGFEVQLNAFEVRCNVLFGGTKLLQGTDCGRHPCRQL